MTDHQPQQHEPPDADRGHHHPLPAADTDEGQPAQGQPSPVTEPGQPHHDPLSDAGTDEGQPTQGQLSPDTDPGQPHHDPLSDAGTDEGQPTQGQLSPDTDPGLPHHDPLPGADTDEGQLALGRSSPVADRGRQRHRLAGAEVVVGHALAGLRMNPGRSLTAAAGLSASVAVMTAAWHAKSLGDGGQVAGMVLLVLLVAATAISVDPRQLRAAAVLDLSGATRRQRRAVVVVEALVLANAAAVVGWVVGGGAAAAAGTEVPSFAAVWAWTIVVAGLAALVTGRSRTRVTAVDAQGHAAARWVPGAGAFPPERSRPRRRGSAPNERPSGFRLLTGLGFVWAGYAMASSSNSFVDLDLLLWPGLTLVWIGMALVLPSALFGAAGLLDRTPWLSAHLGAALLRTRWHLLGPALVLGMATAFAVAVHGILGAGLDEREQRRRAYLDTFEFTASTDARHVVVGRAPSNFLFEPLMWSAADEDGDIGPLRLAPDAADRVRAQYPDAAVAPIFYLPGAATQVDRVLPDPDDRWIAIGTPELLTTAGLTRYADDLAAGRAVALDPSVVRSGEATIELLDLYKNRQPRVSDTLGLPVVVADLPSVPLQLPAVLVPPDVDVPSSADPDHPTPLGPHSLLVRLARPATEADAFALAALVTPGSEPGLTGSSDYGRIEAATGATELTFPYDNGQLDAATSVGLREPGEVRVAVGLVGLVALLGLFVTLRLATVTRRADEQVVESLGAPSSTLRRLAVVQATVATALAISLGFFLGIVLTRQGIAGYNGGTDLPPIPIIVPPVLWVGLVAVPVLAGLIAWLLAWRRPALSPAGLADGLLW